MAILFKKAGRNTIVDGSVRVLSREIAAPLNCGTKQTLLIKTCYFSLLLLVDETVYWSLLSD